MIAIALLAILAVLKYLEVSFMTTVSWWWIIGFAGVLFLWFDFFERLLGLDKRKDDAHYEKMQKERIKRGFKKDKPR